MRGLKLYVNNETIEFFNRTREVVLGVMGGSVFALSVLFAYKTEDLMADSLVQVVDYYRSRLGEYAVDNQYPIRWLTSFGQITIVVEHITGFAASLYFFTLTLSAI